MEPLSLLYKLVGFVLAIGPLVTFHELGHYLVARLCGVKVLRFSFGWGNVVWSRRYGRDQTEWAISSLPIGGYVSMLDSRTEKTAPKDASEYHREFTRKNVWQRIAILAAGPLANFLLAIVVFAGVFMVGVDEPAARLRAAPPTSAAYQAGLRGGERIDAVNGKPVASMLELRWEIVRAAIDKAPAVLAVTNAAGAHTSATIPADATRGLKADGDVLGALGMQLWRPPGRIDKVLPGGAAEQAGLRSGDLVTAIDGVALQDGVAFIDAVRAAPGKVLHATVLRAGQQLTVPVTPATVEAKADVKGGKAQGRIQAMIAQAPEMVRVTSGPIAALGKGAERTWETATMTLRMIGRMFTGEVSWKNVTGPITIADVAGQAAESGLIDYLQFIAFISISLGVMNLLPIPVLDGGHLLYYSLEVLTGRPLPERIIALGQTVGVGLVFMLMALAVFNDISRLL